jgi:hypothetical protein
MISKSVLEVKEGWQSGALAPPVVVFTLQKLLEYVSVYSLTCTY